MDASPGFEELVVGFESTLPGIDDDDGGVDWLASMYIRYKKLTQNELIPEYNNFFRLCNGESNVRMC